MLDTKGGGEGVSAFVGHRCSNVFESFGSRGSVQEAQTIYLLTLLVLVSQRSPSMSVLLLSPLQSQEER